ncbi:Uncharacterised protein [uncultured archaeon]|nr:Uncharacterised protein [uncultured archaeon]
MKQEEVYKRHLDFSKYKNEVIEEIQKYNLHLSNLTLMTIFSLLGGKRFNILNLGQTGVGKSRSTLELVRLLNLNNVICLSGHITSLKFFEQIQENPSAVFVIDESSQILQANSEIVHLLRSALYDSQVVWYSSFKDNFGQQTVKEANFTGSIIFNCNHYKAFNMNDKALLDRLYVNNIRLTTSQIIEKMTSKYELNKEIWALIRERIVQIGEGLIKTELTQEEEKEIENFVVTKLKQVTLTYNANISLRLFEKVREIFYRFKLFFGEIDWDYCKKLSESYFVDINAEENFISKVISSNNNRIKIKELVKIISDFENVALRTSYRRVNEYCDQNQDKLTLTKREIILR